MLARKQTLSGNVTGSAATASSESPVWSSSFGNRANGATRDLLILATHPIGNLVADGLQRAGWSVHFARSAREAVSLIACRGILVGLSVVLPSEIGKRRDEVREILTQFRQVRWIGAFSRGQVEEESVVSLVTEYLYDFLSMPLDPGRLEVILGHAYGMAVLANRHIESQGRERAGRFGMIGGSPAMQDVFHDMERAAKCDLPALIGGKTGTGKETAARAIHASSAYGHQRFVALNCAAIPTARLQTELDAFATPMPAGTSDDQPDHTSAGAGGTLFLDEVSDLPREAQTTLLRFLENERGAHSGAGKPKRRNIRLISTTNRDLQRLAHNGQFRLDLYYRLGALTIELPDVCDRRVDACILAQHFLEEFRRHDNTIAAGLSRDALSAIEQYDWPGNVLELRNRIHQAALCCRTAFLTPADLRLENESIDEPVPTLQEARETAEKQTIWSALRRNRQNLSRAARELRVSRMTLYRLLSKHEMHRGG